MASLNKVFLMGNLTRDPEVKYGKTGDAVCELGMAINRKFRTADGQDRDEVCYVNVVVWRKQAESCGEYLHKGSPVLVEGRLQLQEWEKDGKKNSRLRVVADRVHFMGGPKSGEMRDTHVSEGSKSAGEAGAEAAADEDNLSM